MNETRRLISIMDSRAMTHNSDWARLLDEWDIRPDRNIAAERGSWMRSSNALKRCWWRGENHGKHVSA